jgi:hypothetical protein
MWNPATKKRFRQALIEVYRNYRLLEIFVMDELGERLTVITHEQSLDVVVFDLIEWAEAQGRLDELFAAFCRENPRYVIRSQLSNPPSVSPTYRREVVQTPPVVPVQVVDFRSTATPNPPKPPPKRDTPAAKVKTTSEPQLTLWQQWKWLNFLTGLYVVIGLLLAFCNAPIAVWVLVVASVVAWAVAKARAMASAVASVSEEAWALVSTFAVAVVATVILSSVFAWAWALTLVSTVAVTLFVMTMTVVLTLLFVSLQAWDKAWNTWDYVQTKPDWQKVMIFVTLAGLGLVLGAVLALPF